MESVKDNKFIKTLKKIPKTFVGVVEDIANVVSSDSEKKKKKD